MENKKTNTGIFRLFLGIFLSVLCISVVNAEDACGSQKTKDTCGTQPAECHWVPSTEGEGGKCLVRWSVCNAFNYTADGSKRNAADVKPECDAKGCWWDDSEKNCGRANDSCEARGYWGCAFDSDCSWRNDMCMFKGEKKSQQAVEQIAGFCLCDKTGKDGGKTGIWNAGDCISTQNEFWKEKIPSTCRPVLTNDRVRAFCEANASELSDTGKSRCNKALKYVLKAGSQGCLDMSERIYQNSLKSSDDRTDRRDRDDLCRAQVEEMYPGSVFSGPGLRGGALESHKQLTKSISHETDLKVLVLGWLSFALELTAVIAVVALVYAGILYVTDLGDGGNQEKAKKIIMWVAIGILVILGSYAIVNTLMKADLGDEGRASISTTYLS